MQKSKSQTKIQNYFLSFSARGRSAFGGRVKILEAKTLPISGTSFNNPKTKMQKSKSQTKIRNHFLPLRVKILEAKILAISETSLNNSFAS